MRIRFVPLLCIFFVQPLIAQSTDLQIFLTTEKTTVRTGERFNVTIRVKNVGAASAKEISVMLQAPTTLLDAQVPAGWNCIDDFLSCYNGMLAAGEEAQIVATMLAPANHSPSGSTFSLNATVQGTGDLNYENNVAHSVLQLTHSDRIADLAVSFPNAPLQAREGTPVVLDLTVTNHGPTAADDVLLIVRPSNIVPLTVEGSGWSCSNIGSRIECTTGMLASGASTPLAIRLTTPMQETQFVIAAHAISEGNLDQTPGNDVAFGQISAGSPESWRRILLPLAASDFHGANGSIWRTKTTMFIGGDPSDEFAIRPFACEYIMLHCHAYDWPVGRVFDPAAAELLLDPSGFVNGGSQFLYVRAGTESKLHVNSRVYDVSRETDTAGSEIPIAREDDFSAQPISLLGIPVRSQYRYTLRVYDADALDGARVAVNVFADFESTPRATFEGTLRVQYRQVTTTALLPARPAYLQIDPAQLATLADADTMRIDIEPVTPGLKIWAFVSVTDNDTHHVTTFSAQ